MFERFARRSDQTERLDRGEYSPEEYDRWLREMWYVHRFFGEARALRRALSRIADIRSNSELSVLDVGAGSGDLLRSIGRWLDGNEHLLVGIDENPASAVSIRVKGLNASVANALELPFADKSFDIVTSTLALHHFPDDAAVSLLKEMRRVARDSVLVVDLHRSPVAYYFYRIVGRLLLQRFTWDDGSLSILRGFTPAELQRLAVEAGFEDPRVSRSAAYRLILSGI